MTEKFIEKARAVHDDKYDYSLVEYTNGTTKIIIICHVHGEFEQIPKNHLKGHGCTKCGRDKLRTTKENFVKQAQEIHGHIYDYSLVDYKNANTKVKIICPDHGEFEQLPRSHLSGEGCRKCANQNHIKTTEKFIEQAQEIHGDKYDYSKVEYVGCFDKIIIICPVHGEFEQTPNHHIQGHDCRKCSSNKQRKPIEQFIQKAQEIHGDKYDYSKVNYKGVKEKVTILCPVHGEFEQTPDGHINKQAGCEKCAKDSTRKTTQQFIQEAQKIHGDKYDYSMVKYINNVTNVDIFCYTHGIFEQSPSAHIIVKSGCPYCTNKTEGKVKQFLIDNDIVYEAQYKVQGKKFDFLIDKKFILEIDGRQHFPNIQEGHHFKISQEDRIETLNNDIKKMRSIIETYPVIRLFQEHIWKDTYNWKNLLLNLPNLESETLYIRFKEQELYKLHIANFNVEYI